MRIRTTAAAVITAGLLLTGCSSSDNGKNEPSKPTPTTAPTTAPAKLDKAEAARRCVNALVDQATDDPTGEVGATRPEECAPLDDSEYADAILDATQQANQAGRDQLDEVIGGAG